MRSFGVEIVRWSRLAVAGSMLLCASCAKTGGEARVATPVLKPDQVKITLGKEEKSALPPESTTPSAGDAMSRPAESSQPVSDPKAVSDPAAAPGEESAPLTEKSTPPAQEAAAPDAK
jgi:hypothetical protein